MKGNNRETHTTLGEKVEVADIFFKQNSKR